jgi:hypothetical protein
MLTDHELRHFKTFGFVTLRNLFTPAEVEALCDEYETELDLMYRDEPFTGTTRYWAMMLHPRTPLFHSLLEGERFCSIAEQLYGDDVIGIGTDANRYVGDTGWHPDHGADPEKDCFGVKFAFYLDPVGADTGALRLIPGSHNPDFHAQLQNSLRALELPVVDVPAVYCASSPGDVVAFDVRCWHASHGGASGRRMCTCVYYNNPRGELEEAAARKRGVASKDTPAHFGRPGQPMYPAEWLRNPEGGPKRQLWLERMAQLDYFELPV